MISGMPYFSLSKGEKLGLDREKADLVYDVVNLKIDPRQMDKLLDLDGIYPSYHMSKKTWISLVLDETIPDQTIFELLRGSRSLVAPKHLRKPSEPHYWIIPVNLKYYDIGEEFSSSEDILWTQKASMQKRGRRCNLYYGTYQGHSLSLSGFRSEYP